MLIIPIQCIAPTHVPLLLHVKEGHSVTVFQQQVSGTSIKNAVTRRALDLLGHLITKVLDHQLEQAVLPLTQNNTLIRRTILHNGHVYEYIWAITESLLKGKPWYCTGHVSAFHQPQWDDLVFMLNVNLQTCSWNIQAHMPACFIEHTINATVKAETEECGTEVMWVHTGNYTERKSRSPSSYSSCVTVQPSSIGPAAYPWKTFRQI